MDTTDIEIAVAHAIQISCETQTTVDMPAETLGLAEEMSVWCEGHDDNGLYWGTLGESTWQIRLVAE